MTATLTLTKEELEALQAKQEELLRAYRLTFNSQSGQAVLLDLMSFSKFRAPIEDRADEGKRQVLLRIMNFMDLSMEQLHAAYRGHVQIIVSDETEA